MSDVENKSRQSVPLQIKFSAAATAGQFTSYGATFGGSPDAYGDVIAPGAFAKTIAWHRARSTAPSLLWSHDPNSPIGVLTNLQEDDHGLKVDGKLTLGVARAAEAYHLMKDGALSMSIGYFAVDSTPLGKRGRQLNQINLHEISCVAMPANVSARITSVKVRPNLVDLHNRKVAEKILRDGGYSHSQSKQIVSLATTFFKPRDVAFADQQLARELIQASRAIQKSFS